ncbi:RGCVC family protein [Amycolatopsis sp. NPDC049688]|uniref:RGCVC family protein n=1 Tax=Amycolatopsis sp. NPDC049688 TaxID=3154733 RepID=UPI0034492B62
MGTGPVRTPGPPVTPGDVAVCAACRHAQHTHDPIARRFCTATVAGGFNRGCVCIGGHDEPEKETP